MTKPGAFIVVEGLEGAGKSTAVQVIKTYLENVVPKVVLTREPGGTRLGEIVRSLIKEKNEEEIDPRAELLLLYAARIQLLEKIIYPAVKKGYWVVSDRFELSTLAYQGGGRQLDKNMISTISAISLQGFKPDLIIFLDIDPEEGLLRVKNRGPSDRIEEESLGFFTKVFNSYHENIKNMNNVICINANESLDVVKETICTQLGVFIAGHRYE